MKIHIVQLGDTLWKLAEKYNASFEELKKVNAHLANPEKLMPGMKIKIPGSKKAVQTSKSKKEQQTTPVTTKKEESQPPAKEQQKKEQKKEQPKEQPKTEHPYKQKSQTPIAVLTEDDQKEKKKEQFEAVMPKMPQAPSMPILEKEMKKEKKQVKMEEPPKPEKPKQEKHTPDQQKQPTSIPSPLPQHAEQPQHQGAFDCETYQQPAEMPCEPVAFIPPMMPVFYMPCPPMPQMHPYPVQPGMQQSFPMMPPAGDCGCGGQSYVQPAQSHFQQMPAGFYEDPFGMPNQQFQEMTNHQQQSVNAPNQQTSNPGSYRTHGSDNQTATSNPNADNASFSSYKPNQMPTSASFMNAPRQSQNPAGSQRYFQPDHTALSNSPQEQPFYPKPPFFPEHPDEKHGSDS
ncbi:SafA/ExsA family spore coat assembly protein [Oceanobacillus timonensis]|uniref:SafA/ExsA family spore coat assembly protein n=1 Tax=Oceanobacillus timonensis TaxID=1926285 RepID=UPI00117EE420|nr:SafA/ExsA family spore coat assembly protein [Oceanobacillus timonensis]